jgi:hypothetical protein
MWSQTTGRGTGSKIRFVLNLGSAARPIAEQCENMASARTIPFKIEQLAGIGFAPIADNTPTKLSRLGLGTTPYE